MSIMYDMGSSSFAAPQSMTSRIHVLLVDHDSNHDGLVKEMFTYFSCEVTIVKLASIALSILSTGESQFDLLMENIHSPDSYGFRLLEDATKMNLPVILLTDKDDPIITMRGIEEGAIFCIQKPLTMELLMYLWQHVLRENICKNRENERVLELMAQYKLHNNVGTGQERQERNNVEPSSRPKKRTRSRKNSKKEGESNLQDQGDGKSGKKGWIEWTPELHQKFIDAVRQLGEGGCYPKEILELMNVPKLERMQVASHLQKCRSGHWKVRKRDHETTPLEVVIPPAKSRRYGTMPRLDNLSRPNFNVQENHPENPTEDVDNHSSTRNNGSQMHIINQQDAYGYVPFEHFEDMGHLGFSMNDMFMYDAPSIFDAQRVISKNASPYEGMNWNMQLQEFAMDQMHPSQINSLCPAAIDPWSHLAPWK